MRKHVIVDVLLIVFTIIACVGVASCGAKQSAPVTPTIAVATPTIQPIVEDCITFYYDYVHKVGIWVYQDGNTTSITALPFSQIDRSGEPAVIKGIK